MQLPESTLTDAAPERETPSTLTPSSSPAFGLPPEKPPRTVVVLVVVVALALLGLGAFRLRNSRAPATGKPAVIGLSPDAHTLRLKGTTAAIQSRAILAPVLSGQKVGSLTITKLSAAGIRVKRGDLLVEFDRQAQMRDFLDKQAEYNNLVGEVAEQRAKEDAARAKDETELHQANSDLESAKLEMKRVELMSRIDAEKAQETLEQARATLDQLQETFDLKRRAARAAIHILEIQRDRTQRTMQNAQTNAELMQIHSPLDGVVVLNTIWKNGRMGEVQEGDRIEPGVPFMRVVNPAAMQVEVLVNQEDILRLQIGQPAQVRLDAYPEFALPGKLEQTAPIGRTGSFSSKVRTFTAIFSVQGTDARLMPDLSAAVDVSSNPDKVAANPSKSSAPYE